MMKKKTNLQGKSLPRKEMKKLRGGAPLIGADKCIPPGAPCGGGGCDDPPPVCCNGYVCTGSNGIIYDPGFCVYPGSDI
jgi:hypothetical protein